MDTETIIQELASAYPSIGRDTLLELLLVCNGSKSSTESLINESMPPSLKKRKVEKPRYQSSLSTLISKSQPQATKQKNPLQGEDVSSHSYSPSTHIPTFKTNPKHHGSDKNSRSKPARTKIIKLYHPDDVKEHLHPYVSFHRSFLPTDLSNNLLKHLLENTKKFTNNEFYLFGQLCKSDHATGVFQSEGSKSTSSNAYVYNGERVEQQKYSSVLKEAATLSEKFINEKILPPHVPLPFEQDSAWKGDRCVINYYENGSNHLDWHSDRLSHIGPHCFIVSISLGATREFRLRRNYNNHAMTEEEEKLPTTIYSIVVPHNSMLIMYPGCQEEFKHCVQSMPGPLEINPIAGPTRFNLTYRYFPEDFVEHIPHCKCDISMTLRRAYKDVRTRGRYFWSCEKTYQNNACGTFYWADFSNMKGNFVYEPPNGDNDKSNSVISEWVAHDDYAKQRFLQREIEKKKNQSADLKNASHTAKDSKYVIYREHEASDNDIDDLKLGEDDLYT